MRVRLLLLVFVLFALPAAADDGAASIAAGGLVLMKREPRIVMAKEVLRISDGKVVVDYDFRNDSTEDITTAVAFPIPEYVDDYDGPAWKLAAFDDFKLTINGVSTKYQTETRAFAKSGEITELLATYGIDAASFGHEYQDKNGNIINDLSRLSKARMQKLEALHAVSGNNPDWSVKKKYYWTQTFPTHGTVHIRHEYTPVMGNSNTIGDPADYQGKDAVPEYAESCPTPALRATLSKIWNKPGAHDSVSPLWISYVSFILTTANTWKTPIEDFTLIVERPHLVEEQPNPAKVTTYVSFCWDGPVEKIDADHFSAHLVNFVPKKELQIGFIHSQTH